MAIRLKYRIGLGLASHLIVSSTTLAVYITRFAIIINYTHPINYIYVCVLVILSACAILSFLTSIKLSYGRFKSNTHRLPFAVCQDDTMHRVTRINYT